MHNFCKHKRSLKKMLSLCLPQQWIIWSKCQTVRAFFVRVRVLICVCVWIGIVDKWRIVCGKMKPFQDELILDGDKMNLHISNFFMNIGRWLWISLKTAIKIKFFYSEKLRWIFFGCETIVMLIRTSLNAVVWVCGVVLISCVCMHTVTYTTERGRKHIE